VFSKGFDGKPTEVITICCVVNTHAAEVCFTFFQSHERLGVDFVEALV